MIPNNKLLLDVCNVAIEAGKEILTFYNNDIEVTHKEDLSPLTKADLASNKIILESLKKINSNTPILSEESLVDWSIRKNWKKYWLVDPLDGTKEFIKKNDEFTVNIALIEDNIPCLGVIYAPAKSLLYLAEKDKGSFLNNQRLRVSKRNSLNECLFSSNHEGVKFSNLNLRYSGCAALDLAYVASGRLDGYFQNKINLWDVAAGSLMVREAGGIVNDLNKFKANNIDIRASSSTINDKFLEKLKNF